MGDLKKITVASFLDDKNQCDMEVVQDILELRDMEEISNIQLD